MQVINYGLVTLSVNDVRLAGRLTHIETVPSFVCPYRSPLLFTLHHYYSNGEVKQDLSESRYSPACELTLIRNYFRYPIPCIASAEQHIRRIRPTKQLDGEGMGLWEGMEREREGREDARKMVQPCFIATTCCESLNNRERWL